MDKNTVKIGDINYSLKYTLEAWKKLKSEHDITPSNFQVKLEEDMAGAVSALVYFGLLPADREKVKVEEIDECLEFKVIDIVSKAVLAGLPEVKENKLEKKNTSEDTSEKK